MGCIALLTVRQPSLGSKPPGNKLKQAGYGAVGLWGRDVHSTVNASTLILTRVFIYETKCYLYKDQMVMKTPRS